MPDIRALEVFMDVDAKRRLQQAIGRAIARQRKAAGLTQADVAERLDLSNDAVSRLERGNIVPSALRLFELAEVFGCEVADLLNDSSPHSLDQALRLQGLLTRLDAPQRQLLLQAVELLVEMSAGEALD